MGKIERSCQRKSTSEKVKILRKFGKASKKTLKSSNIKKLITNLRFRIKVYFLASKSNNLVLFVSCS